MTPHRPERPGSPAERKVVLMRHLARSEAARLGLGPTPEDIADATEKFRREFGLLSFEALTRFLAYARMSVPQFQEMMIDFAALTKVEGYYVDEVDRRLPDHWAIHKVRPFIEQSSS